MKSGDATGAGAQQADALLARLEHGGWYVARIMGTPPPLPRDAATRFAQLPSDVAAFLRGLERCASASGQAWFLGAEDFAAPQDGSFRWNELELMSLDDATEAERARISAFWASHFPIMLTTHSDYDYLAVALTPAAFGSIVHGFAPEFEAAEVVAGSFTELLHHLASAADGCGAYPFTLFVGPDAAADETNDSLLQGVTALAMSSATLLAAARRLPIGARLRFVPCEVCDGGPLQPVLGHLTTPHCLRRIALPEIPSAYGVQEADLVPGSLAFLISAEASPHLHELAIIDPM